MLINMSSRQAKENIKALIQQISFQMAFAKCQPFCSGRGMPFNICWVFDEVGLTHWGRVMHIWVRNLTTIGSDNGLSLGRHQAIIWTNAGVLLIGPLGTNFSEILIETHIFSFKKINFKMSSGKWWPCCLCLNVLYSISQRSNWKTNV